MKNKCEIIKDLIPLAVDEVCSKESREAVEEHIKICDSCRQLYEHAKIKPPLYVPSVDTDETKVLNKGLRKIKRRWFASLLIVVLLVPLCILAWGQYCGRGPSFTNINEMIIANNFMKDLEKGEYEEAFGHLDINSLKEDWLEEWFDEEKLKDMESDSKRVFCDSASLLKSVGGIKEFRFLAIDEQSDYYTVYYTVKIDGKEQRLELYVSDEGIVRFSGSGSFLDDPLAYFGAWTEHLWQEYEGCYFNPETAQYEYYNK